MNTANVWRRLGAYILDMFILYIPFGIILMAFIFPYFFNMMEMMSVSEPTPQQMQEMFMTMFKMQGISVLSFGLIFWLYNALMESSAWQATLGKKVFFIKVVDQNGARLSFGRASARALGKLLSSYAWPVFLAVFFTDKNQALHDMPVKTYVVYAEIPQPQQQAQP